MTAPLALRDLAEEISITTLRVWKNNIGKGGIKDFFKGGGIKEGGDYLKRGDKYPLRTMLLQILQSRTINNILLLLQLLQLCFKKTPFLQLLELLKLLQTLWPP